MLGEQKRRFWLPPGLSVRGAVQTGAVAEGLPCLLFYTRTVTGVLKGSRGLSPLPGHRSPAAVWGFPLNGLPSGVSQTEGCGLPTESAHLL